MLSVKKRHERDTLLDRLNDPTLFREFAYVDGEWRSGDGDAKIDVSNPADGSWLGSVASLSAESVFIRASRYRCLFRIFSA